MHFSKCHIALNSLRAVTSPHLRFLVSTPENSRFVNDFLSVFFFRNLCNFYFFLSLYRSVVIYLSLSVALEIFSNGILSQFDLEMINYQFWKLYCDLLKTFNEFFF